MASLADGAEWNSSESESMVTLSEADLMLTVLASTGGARESSTNCDVSYRNVKNGNTFNL